MKTSFRLLLYSVLTILAFAVIFYVSYPDTDDWNGIKEEEDITVSQKLFNRFYISSCIYSTIGMGQLSPKKTGAKILVIIEMLIVTIGLLRLLVSTKEAPGTFFFV